MSDDGEPVRRSSSFKKLLKLPKFNAGTKTGVVHHILCCTFFLAFSHLYFTSFLIAKKLFVFRDFLG